MIGLINIILTVIGKIGNEIEESVRDQEAYKRTYNKETNTYLDRYLVERRPNGEYCKTTRDLLTGDLIQVDKNGTVVKNFSKEKIDKYNSDINRTVIRLTNKNMHTDEYHEPIGIRYKDKITGKEYVIRYIKIRDGLSLHFYMDIDNAHLVKVTDGEKLFGKKYDLKEINDFIKEFNKEQDSLEVISNVVYTKTKFLNNRNRIDVGDTYSY